MNDTVLVETLLRGIAAGAQAGLGLSLAASARNASLRIATILFVGANIAFVLNGAAAIRHVIGPGQEVLWLVQIGSAGLLWLFAVALFEDRDLSLAAFAPALGLTSLGLIARIAPPTVAPSLWTLHNLAGLAVALHAIAVILRSGRTDLIEERRRLRVPLLAVIAGYSVLLSVAQIGQLAGFRANWYGIADATIQALLGLAGTVVLLEARAALFGRAETAAPAVGSDPDVLWLDRLETAMQQDALWQREGLTIADVASIVGLPEHRLRRLINDRLGHRNFPSFVNQHRIVAARTMLADPGLASRTVASIAYELGFGSLGPFNRAFRDATGVTPTEYRRRALSLPR